MSGGVSPNVTLPNTNQIQNFRNIPTEYKSYIDTSSSKHGVPSNILQGVIFQESSYNPNARSPVGAQGIAQFMPATSRQYGVNVTDPKSSIDGAARYLKDLYTQFGDWTLAVAAYNAGPNRDSLKRGQIPNIPETQNYVARVMSYANSIK